MTVPILFIHSFFILSRLVVLTETCRDRLFCPVKDEGQLKFSRGVNALNYAVAGHSPTLHCCTYGYDVIEWYKNVTSECAATSGWKPYPWNNPDMERCEGNQTLRINSVSSSCGKGEYSCIARNTTTGEHIQHNMTLIVVVCDHRARPVFRDEPRNQTVTIGSEMVVNCAGYYGCQNDNRNPVMWRVVEHKGNKTTEKLAGIVPGIQTNKTAWKEEEVYGSVLTIKRVERRFIGMKLRCLLGTKSKDVPSVLITLFEKEEPKSYAITIIAISVALGIIVIAVATYVVAVLTYGPHISFLFRRLFGKLPKRGEFDFDAIVIAAEEDCEFVTTKLCPKLEEEKGYKIWFPERELILGKPQLAELEKGVTKCYTVLIVYSCAFVESNLHRYIFDTIRQERQGNIVLIRYGKETSLHQNKQAPKLLSKVDWPGDTCTSHRKMTNFWSSLYQKLPYVENGRVIKNATSGGQYDDERDSPSVQLIRDQRVQSPGRMVTNSESDNVFLFDSLEFKQHGPYDQHECGRQRQVLAPTDVIVHRNSNVSPNREDVRFALEYPSESSEVNMPGTEADSQCLISNSGTPNCIAIAPHSQRQERHIIKPQASADSGYSSGFSSGNLQSISSNHIPLNEKLIPERDDILPLISK